MAANGKIYGYYFQKRASSSCEIYTQRLLHGTGSVLLVMVEGFNK